MKDLCSVLKGFVAELTSVCLSYPFQHLYFLRRFPQAGLPLIWVFSVHNTLFESTLSLYSISLFHNLVSWLSTYSYDTITLSSALPLPYHAAVRRERALVRV